MPTVRRIPEDALIVTIRRLLRPVVRQLLAWGVSYPVFDRVVRGLFVEVAEDDFALPAKKQTDSRVSLVTGIHRKEIARLRRLPREERNAPPLERSVVTRVIGRWLSRPPYADRSGRARPLPYERAGRARASFAALVADAGFDGPVRSVLDEMLRIGAATFRDDGTVVLESEAHLPTRDLGTKLDLLGSEPAELFRTIAHNIDAPDAPWLQRKVVYDNVGAAALPALRSAAREEGEALMRRANALLGAQDRDRNPGAPGGARSRVVLATYWYEEPVEPASDAAGTAATGTTQEKRTLPGRITARGATPKRSE
jgi:hypothetical protein